jgi:hypothetical protein
MDTLSIAALPSTLSAMPRHAAFQMQIAALIIGLGDW